MSPVWSFTRRISGRTTFALLHRTGVGPMAARTDAIPHVPTPKFYFGLSLVFALVAFGGFIPSYVAPPAGQFPPIVHLHAALFFAWPSSSSRRRDSLSRRCKHIAPSLSPAFRSPRPWSSPRSP